MKKFRHKNLGWIAVKEEKEKYNGQYAIFNGGDFAVKERNDNPATQPDRVYMMYPELIEGSNDREEVVETKDWISNCVEEFRRTTPKLLRQENYFRVILEQHMPKVKKFTRNDIKKWMGVTNDYSDNQLRRGLDSMTAITSQEDIESFLQDHGLLEE